MYLKQPVFVVCVLLQLFCSYDIWHRLNVLHYYVSTSRNVCVQCPIWLFCSSLTSCLPGMWLRYFLNDTQIVPIAPVVTGITFVFAFYMLCISIVRSLYFRIFPASFLHTFLSP